MPGKFETVLAFFPYPSLPGAESKKKHRGGGGGGGGGRKETSFKTKIGKGPYDFENPRGKGFFSLAIYHGKFSWKKEEEEDRDERQRETLFIPAQKTRETHFRREEE